MLDHGIEDSQQFTHAGCDGDLLRLACIDQASVELLEDWVEAHGDQGGHVEGGPDGSPTAPAGAGSSHLAAVPGERGNANEGSDLSAVQPPNSGKPASRL